MHTRHTRRIRSQRIRTRIHSRDHVTHNPRLVFTHRATVRHRNRRRIRHTNIQAARRRRPRRIRHHQTQTLAQGVVRRATVIRARARRIVAITHHPCARIKTRDH